MALKLWLLPVLIVQRLSTSIPEKEDLPGVSCATSLVERCGASVVGTVDHVLDPGGEHHFLEELLVLPVSAADDVENGRPVGISLY